MSSSASRAPRVLFLTEWFDPEPAMKGLRFARALQDRGFEVEVATGIPNYPGGNVYPGYRNRAYQRENMDGVTVHRLFLYPSHDGSGLRRMLTYSSFFVSALLFLLWRMRRYDVVYVYHPPIMPGFAAALASIVHRRPFALEVQDLWPDSVAASGMGRPWVARLLGCLCAFTYARAAAVVPQSDGMKATLAARGVSEAKMVRIYNWSNYVAAADCEKSAAPAAIAAAMEGRVNFVYGGNIGQAQALEAVVEAAARAARDVPALRLHLVGAGIDRSKIAEAIARHAPGGEVILHDAVDPRTMDRVFDRADVLVMHLKDDPLYEITIPSKTQHYLSTGKPIVAGISGEAGRILRSSGAARVVRCGDVAGLAEAMAATARLDEHERQRMGQTGRDYYRRQLSFCAAMATKTCLLNRLSDRVA